MHARFGEEELKAEERKEERQVVVKEEAKTEAYCDQLREKLAQNAELRYQREHVVRPKVVAVKGQYDKMMRAISKVREQKGEKRKEERGRMKDQMAEEVK